MLEVPPDPGEVPAREPDERRWRKGSITVSTRLLMWSLRRKAICIFCKLQILDTNQREAHGSAVFLFHFFFGLMVMVTSRGSDSLSMSGKKPLSRR